MSSIFQRCQLVDITYLTSDTTYRNCFGYIVHEGISPPSKWEDVQEIVIIFPNASSEALESSDTVELMYEYEINIDAEGRNIASPKNPVFPAGKAVSFFFLQDGWDSDTNSVNSDTKCASLFDLNTSDNDFERYRILSFSSNGFEGSQERVPFLLFKILIEMKSYIVMLSCLLL